MALEGTLHDMSLNDLFQIFSMGRKTGLLMLASGVERGLVYVSSGEVIDAAVICSVDRSVRSTSEAAVLQLLGWESAHFSFRHDPAVARRPARIQLQSTWLVLKGMQGHPERLRRDASQTITLDHTVEPGPMSRSLELWSGLHPDQRHILEQVVASTSLRDLAADVTITVERLLQLVTELVALGLLQVRVAPWQRATAAAGHTPAAPSGAAGLGLPELPSPRSTLLRAIRRRISGL